MTLYHLKGPGRLRVGSSGIAPRAVMKEGTTPGGDEMSVPRSFPLFIPVRCDGPVPRRGTHPAVSGPFSVIAVSTRAAAHGGERETVRAHLRAEDEIGV